MVGRSMTDVLRLCLVSWCWVFVHCTSALRTRSLNLWDKNGSDLNLTTPELIKKYGYPVEVHDVHSADGYILQLHRIPYGLNVKEAVVRPPVLVHHALLCSSFDWVVMGPSKSLAFILADAGYDVWLANARGNTYSRRHETLDPSENKFWQFSWHEMGIYDVPAEIDYILYMTGHPKLFYIGHSMGTTMFFVMMSERPEYNAKVNVMMALAPVAAFTPTKKPLVHFLQRLAEGFLEKMFNLIGYQEFLPQNSILNPLSRILCKENAITKGLCKDFMFFITGKSTELYEERLTVMLAHTPAGASTRQVMHFAQEALSGEFRRFDFGTSENVKIYGQATPPKYNLSNAVAPIALYYSDNDKLAPYYNVKKLFKALPNPIGKFRVPKKTFNHLDFMWAKDADTLLYVNLLQDMNKYKDGWMWR